MTNCITMPNFNNAELNFDVDYEIVLSLNIKYISTDNFFGIAVVDSFYAIHALR